MRSNWSEVLLLFPEKLRVSHSVEIQLPCGKELDHFSDFVDRHGSCRLLGRFFRIVLHFAQGADSILLVSTIEIGGAVHRVGLGALREIGNAARFFH